MPDIHVTYSGRTAKTAVPADMMQFRGNLAAEFDLLGVDVAGFARGGTLFPLSYVIRSNSEFLASTKERPLELLALSPRHLAADPSGVQTDKPIITFMLANSGKSVTVRRKEMELMSFVREKLTSAGKTSLDELRAAYDRNSQAGTLRKSGFDDMMRELIADGTLTELERKILSAALTRIFFAFDRDGDGVVVGLDLFTALGTMVTGKGLAFAFRVADANQDGFISPAEFLTFTRAFLTLVLAFTDDVADLSADFVSALIDATTENVVRRAFQEADLNRDGLLTWSEFSTWYKNGGHTIMPWVSLMQSSRHESGVVAAAGNTKQGSVESNVVMDDTNEMIYEFLLAPTYGSLAITRTDVDNLEHLLKKTRLYEADVEETIEALFGMSDVDGTISKDAFDTFMKAMVPTMNSLRREDRTRITYVLNNVFFAFDRTGSRCVRADEFCTGFSLFCNGSKSTKLQLCYYLFDVDEDGTIRALDFARFLRSVLTMLFALNDAAASMTSFQVYEAIDRTTARATRVMLKSLADARGESTPPMRISFEDFATFYNTQSGNELISFVELLDLSKFPFTEIAQAVSRDRQPFSAGSDEEGNDDESKYVQAEDEDPIVFSFDLLPSPEVLEVRQSHADRLKRAAHGSRIASMTPEVLHQYVAEACKNRSTISKQEFERLAHSLGAGSSSPRELTYILNSLFYAYDRDGKGREISTAECASGLSILCAGKKSDKLAYGFAAFDADDNGALSPEEVARFIRGFLTALFALVQDNIDQEAEGIWTVADSTSLGLTGDVIKGSQEPHSHHFGDGLAVTFEDFAEWYGQGGFKVASFLELLDMGKWPSSSVAFETDQNHSYVPDELNSKSSSAQKASKGQQQPVFVFQMTKDYAMEVEEGDVEFIRQLVKASGLNRVAPEELLHALSSRADELNVVHEDQYKLALKSLFGTNAEDPEFALDALETLYEVCDRDGLGCDVRDLLGLLFLCSGSKSTKLAHCWNAVDADHDGDLTRIELFLLLRSFLNALHAFNYGANSSPIEEVNRHVDDASGVLGANIFLSARRKKKDTVSFEEFAEFYSEGGGYRMAPWLELLNLSKFIGVEHAEPLTIKTSTSAVKKETASKPESDDQQQSKVVFAFHLTESDDALVVTVKDVTNLKALLRMSKFASMDAEQLIQLITTQVGSSGKLSEQAFGTFVGMHVLNGRDSTEDEFVAGTLYRLFKAFDREDEGSVDPVSFAVGLSLLAAGSKSSKLSLGWALFSRGNQEEEYGVGPLTRESLVEFLVALLTGISCFAGNCLDEDIIRIAAVEATERVFMDLSGNEVSFDGFAAWYTSRGFEYLSWIELLANSKWKLPSGGV